MALDPVVTEGVAFLQLQKPLPEVWVQRRLFCRFSPSPSPPPLGPALGESVNDVFESDHSSTTQGSFSMESASMTAVSSMRLLVVSGAPPESSFFVGAIQ